MLALAILGLVAGIVYPRVARAPGAADIRAEVQEVAALLRTDRNAALRHRRVVVSGVDLANGAVISGISARRVAFPRGTRVEFIQSSREARAAGGGIRFLPDGRSSGGVLFFRRGEIAYQISVNWLTSGIVVGVERDAGGEG